MAKFIAVVHTWFIHSTGFYVEEFEAENREAAMREKYRLSAKYNQPFSHAAVEIIQVEPPEGLVRTVQSVSPTRIIGRLSVWLLIGLLLMWLCIKSACFTVWRFYWRRRKAMRRSVSRS